MSVKSISTQQAGQVLDATHFLQLSTGPVLIYGIEGESTSAGAALYIQLHSVSPVSTTTVPLYSRLCVQAAATAGQNGFSFTYPGSSALDTSAMPFPEGATTGGSNTTGVWVAISSTDNVYTSVAASTQVQVMVEETYLELPNLVITGDSTTAVDSLAVYTDPNDAKLLVQFQAKNNLGADAYIMLFAAAAVNGATPIQQWKVANGATVTQRFGSGQSVYSQDTAFALHTGCYLYGSSTTQTLTKTVGTNWNLKAWNL